MVQKFTSLYKEDPIAAELEAGIQATDVYQGSPYALANVPEFEGVQYATPNYKRYEDLYSLYMGGGFDAAQPDFVTPPADTTQVDTGGGGGNGGQDQATGASVAGFDPGITPGPSGFIGLDPDMDIDPQNFAQNDYGIYDPTATTDDITVEDLINYQSGEDPTGLDMSGTISGAPVVGDFNEPIMGTVDVTKSFVDQPIGTIPPDTIGPQSISTIVNPEIFDNYAGVDDPQIGDPNFENYTMSTEEQTLGNKINSAFENVKGKGTAGIQELKDNLVALGGRVKEGFENIVDFGDTQIDVGKTLATGALNYIGKSIFGPVGAVLGTTLGALKPDKYNEEALGALDEIDMLKTTAGGLTVDKYGKNVQSITGDYDDYNLERQIDLQEQFEKSKENYVEEYGSLTAENEYGKNWEEMNKRNLQELEDRKEIEQKLNETRLEEAQQEQKDYVQEIEAQPAVDTTTQSGRDEADRQQKETGVATVETDYGTRYESSGGVFASAEEAAEKGDGPSNGGGKIVCTMMNDSYGFGSFRNKIWLRHSKDLAPEYQIGYHKIFLPLVRLSKTNKLLKKTLEHIAVHRTIDIRQEARGKVHLLGRVYRKILEPICYWVGKYAKR